MYPFECQTCKKRHHGINVTQLRCCPNAKFSQLVSICLLVPKKEAETHTVVHVSGDYMLPSPVGVEWVTGCNAKRRPDVVTRSPVAVTCGRCLKFYEKRIEEEKKKREETMMREHMESIEVEVEVKDSE